MAAENPYQVSGNDVLYQWLSEQTDPGVVDAMLGWLPELAADPYSAGQHIPRPGVPMLVAATPVSNIVVVYSVVEQYHTIRLIRFDTV